MSTAASSRAAFAREHFAVHGHRATAKRALPNLKPAEAERFKTFWARATVCARLLQSRLALPLTYPMNSVSVEHLKQYDRLFDDPDRSCPEDQGFDAVASGAGQSNTGGKRDGQAITGLQEDSLRRAYSAAKQAEVLARMRPVLIGMAHVATIVKSLHAIGHYRGNIDRKVEPTPDITRMDFLRPQNLRRRRRNTRIGIGDGWEAYGSGRPVDDVQRRFVFDLKEDEIRKRKIMEQHQLASRKELENDPEDEDGGK